MAEAKFYVYVHRRADTGEVFYIGKGKGNRSVQSSKRSDYWKRVVEKYGLVVEILEYWADESDALAHERYLIASYRAIGASLCNLTDGGEGISGYVFSEDQRKARAEYLALPEIKEKHLRNTELAMQRPGVKEKADAARRAALAKPEVKEKHSKALSEAQRGKPFTDAHKQALADSYNKPGVRERHGELIKAAYERPGVRERRKAVNAAIKANPEHRAAFLKTMQSDEHREKMRALNVEAMARPEVKERHRAAMKLWHEKRRLERLAST
jgi:hypothetical protein